MSLARQPGGVSFPQWSRPRVAVPPHPIHQSRRITRTPPPQPPRIVPRRVVVQPCLLVLLLADGRNRSLMTLTCTTSASPAAPASRHTATTPLRPVRAAACNARLRAGQAVGLRRCPSWPAHAEFKRGWTVRRMAGHVRGAPRGPVGDRMPSSHSGHPGVSITAPPDERRQGGHGAMPGARWSARRDRPGSSSRRPASAQRPEPGPREPILVTPGAPSICGSGIALDDRSTSPDLMPLRLW